MHDLRIAIRMLRSTPLVTVVAIVSLALGIGANTAIFSIVDNLLLRNLPVEQPDRLVLVLSRKQPGFNRWSYPLWEQIRERRHELFQAAFAFSPTRFNLAQGGETDLVEGLWVSGNVFDALGVSPMLGRAFTEDDDRRGGGPDGPVAVISYAFWQRLGGGGDVVGRTQMVDRVPFTIVGVMPPNFFGVIVGGTFDIAVPIGTEPLLRGRESWLNVAGTSWLRIIARLKDGQTVEVAEQALRGVQPQIREATIALQSNEESKARHLAQPFALQSAARGVSPLGDRYRQALIAIMAVVALVLLIACANVANLLLARAESRRHEFSVRLALGGSRWRLARQLLVESCLVAGIGALIGLAIAQWGSVLLVQQLSTKANTVFLNLQIDWRVLAFTAIVAAIVALVFGVVPALRASRTRPMEAIRQHGRGTDGIRRVGLGSALVVGQVALSLLLVVAAGLFVRTFASLATVDLGFDRDAVLLVRFDAQGTGVEPTQRAALYERVLEAVRSMPAVSNAAVSEVTPVSGWILDVAVEIENGPRLTTQGIAPYKNAITPGWFATYGTPLVGGRDFDARDRLMSPPVAIVNETFARRFLAGRNPIGHRFRNAFPPPSEQSEWIEIVGVAADATYLSVRQGVPPTMYVPMAQQKVNPPNMSLSVRAATGSSTPLVRAIADVIGRVDRNLAITVTPLTQQVHATLVQERIVAMLSGFFGALALLLAGLGLYGVTSYAVSRRRTEIGIRMAVGAAPSNVVRLVLTRVFFVISVGMLLGVGLSTWTSKYVATLLYGLGPRDPVTIASSAVVLAIVGALAGWIPAYRASRIDPSQALRDG